MFYFVSWWYSAILYFRTTHTRTAGPIRRDRRMGTLVSIVQLLNSGGCLESLGHSIARHKSAVWYHEFVYRPTRKNRVEDGRMMLRRQ